MIFLFGLVPFLQDFSSSIQLLSCPTPKANNFSRFLVGTEKILLSENVIICILWHGLPM
jgi:hypothetical protein